MPSFVSYPPIATKYFYYRENGIRTGICIHYSGELKKSNYLKTIIDLINTLVPNRVFLLNFRDNVSLITGKNVDSEIVTYDSYTFETISELYSMCKLAIIPEKNGTFEGVPIEAIASGVPVVAPQLSSLLVIKEILKNNHISEDQCFDLNRAEPDLVTNWLISVEPKMKNISKIVGSSFDPKTIMKSFLENLTGNTSVP